MNNLKFLFGMFLLVIVLCVISCEKDTVPMNFIPEMSTAKVDETTITRVQAMVGGNIVQGTSIIDEQGILYSTASSEYFTDTAKITSLDSDGNFTVLLQGLEPGKTYYYCTYVKSGPTLARANVETFTTNEDPETGIAVTGQVDTYGITYAVVGGSVNLDLLPAGAGNPEIGVEYSYVASDGTTKSLQKQIDSLTDNAFNVELSNLSPATECKYRSYVRYGGIRYYGEYRTFTTKSLVNITIPGEATDISLNSAKVTSNVDTDKLDGKDALTVGIAYSTSASALHPDSIFSSETLPVNDAVNGVFTVTLSNLSEMTAYYYASFTETDGVYCFSEIKTFKTLEFKIEPVDLGLSVKWANCNIGASSPEDHGGYYAWGEIEEKYDYDSYTYKWMGSYGLIKYCVHGAYGVVDENRFLDLEDDVANVKWGNGWRIPSHDEMNELVENCTWKWATFRNVYGYFVTGSNGNSIFLPVTGYLDGTNFEFRDYGFYWINEIIGGDDFYSKELGFSETHISCTGYGTIMRYYGLTVRPVMDK